MLPHPSRWRSESVESGSVHFLHIKQLLVHFVVCTSSYWLGQQSFTNLIMLCRVVISYKNREGLNRDGVTLLCWWGNIHNFERGNIIFAIYMSYYPSYHQGRDLLKIHVLTYRGCINIDGENGEFTSCIASNINTTESCPTPPLKLDCHRDLVKHPK